MKQFISKIGNKVADKAQGASSHGDASAPGVETAQIASLPPQVLQYRYRKQVGVNLGAWFSLEKWLVPSLFQGVDSASSEHDLWTSGKLPPNEVAQRLARHWSYFVDAGDWNWMREHGINTVRLPIAYFHFCPSIAPHLMQGTEYEQYAEAYKPAWSAIQNALQTAGQHGIGVLVDLHGVPGGQGADGHTGLSGGKPGFFKGKNAGFCQQRTVEILVELVKAVGGYDNVVGVELMNEPINHDAYKPWVDTTISRIRSCSPEVKVSSMPLYISDCWDAHTYAKRYGAPSAPGNFLAIDTHVYRAFTPDDHRKSAAEHAQGFRRGGGTYGWMHGAAQHAKQHLIVGEWSAALHHTSFQGGQDRVVQQKDWATSQLGMYNDLASGHFFWTLKKEGAPDPGWCLYSAVEAGVLPADLTGTQAGGGGRATRDEMIQRSDQAGRGALAQHSGYWDRVGGNYEHWRFQDGWAAGRDEALGYWFDGGRSLIGFPRNAAILRAEKHVQEKGASGQIWEFHEGYAQAVQAFNQHMLS